MTCNILQDRNVEGTLPKGLEIKCLRGKYSFTTRWQVLFNHRCFSHLTMKTKPQRKEPPWNALCTTARCCCPHDSPGNYILAEQFATISETGKRNLPKKHHNWIPTWPTPYHHHHPVKHLQGHCGTDLEMGQRSGTKDRNWFQSPVPSTFSVSLYVLNIKAMLSAMG